MTAVSHLVRKELLDGKAVLLELGPPPSNLVDRQMVGALADALRDVASEKDTKLVVLAGAGEHFSYGASVQEHLPGEVEQMLPEFHLLLRLMQSLPLPPILAAVRGRCLGGGFELALACDLLWAEDDARLGVPEIRLGVFPPAAAALLPLRVSAGVAAQMILTGEPLLAFEALEHGIVDFVAPAGQLFDAIENWGREHLLGLSAAALRQGRRAQSWPRRNVLAQELPELERQYLEELMLTHDAREGLDAFLSKRQPDWEDR